MTTDPQGYAGDLTPREAWRLLESEPGAVLIDVRTDAEWRNVGVPRLDAIGKTPALVEWQDLSGGLNPRFLEEVKAHGLAPDAPVLLLCRSGVRSRSAAIALTRAGFRTCINVADGFEGPPGPDGRRNVAGWKVEGLPWGQL
jgi:rhodanese-related sulfurtransferase